MARRGNHLGSVSTVTNQSGAIVATQQFDPWGKVRSGGISVTDLNYTGQRKDDTGLLYYHARYYDPSLARFVSPDSIVPGASGVLAIDFPKSRLAASSQSVSPQELNRYAYVGNNPVAYNDPSGHCRTADGDSRPYAQGPGCESGKSSGNNAGSSASGSSDEPVLMYVDGQMWVRIPGTGPNGVDTFVPYVGGVDGQGKVGGNGFAGGKANKGKNSGKAADDDSIGGILGPRKYQKSEKHDPNKG